MASRQQIRVRRVDEPEHPRCVVDRDADRLDQLLEGGRDHPNESCRSRLIDTRSHWLLGIGDYRNRASGSRSAHSLAVGSRFEGSTPVVVTIPAWYSIVFSWNTVGEW